MVTYLNIGKQPPRRRAGSNSLPHTDERRSCSSPHLVAMAGSRGKYIGAYVTHKSHKCLSICRGCFDANFISIPCFPLTPILTYVQVHSLPIQSEHNASTVRKVRSACVPFVSSVRPQCTKIRMRFGRPSGHPCFWLPPFVHYLQCSSSRSLNISNRHALSTQVTCLKPLYSPPGQMLASHSGNWQKPRTLLCPPISCPRAHKQKEKCDDAEEATASKIVHRNVVIIKDSSVETLFNNAEALLEVHNEPNIKSEYWIRSSRFPSSPPLPQPSHSVRPE